MADYLNPYATRDKRTVEITAQFPGSAIPGDFENPRAMLLRQKAKSHDLMVLTYTVQIPDPERLLRTGSPVIVTWSTTNVNEAGVWVGYVHTVSSQRTGNVSGVTEITCVSPSMILKQGAQDVWVNTPVTDAAARIITSAGLDARVIPHALTDTIIQHGRTYWQVLRQIAALTGYALTTDQATVVMVPHRQFFDDYAARARVFSPGASLETDVYDSDRSLYRFIPDFSDMSEDTYADHSRMHTWSVDPRSGQAIRADSLAPPQQIFADRPAPVINRFSARVAHSPTEARILAEDALSDRRWVNQGTLIGLGSPDLAPYRPVYVEGISTSVDGWWQILEVDHDISGRTEYQARMRVGRDGQRLSIPAPQRIPALSPAQIAERAGSPLIKREPVFISDAAAANGLTGFADVGGRWTTRRTS